MMLTGIAVGIAVGLALGLTGAGGSILAVPLLVWAFGWSLQQAAPVGLLAVCASACLGTLIAWDVKLIRYRLAMVMALAGTILAPLGIWIAAALPQNLLSALLAAIMAISAARMWRQSQPKMPIEDNENLDALPGWQNWCALHPDTGRIIWTRTALLTVSGVGAMAGFLAGLLGASGGVVMVPGLRSFSVLSMHSAVATTLMASAIISACTVGQALLHGHELPWRVALPFVAGAVAGMLAGRRIAPAVPGAKLQQSFALLVLLGGLGMAGRAMQLL